MERQERMWRQNLDAEKNEKVNRAHSSWSTPESLVAASAGGEATPMEVQQWENAREGTADTLPPDDSARGMAWSGLHSMPQSSMLGLPEVKAPTSAESRTPRGGLREKATTVVSTTVSAVGAAVKTVFGKSDAPDLTKDAGPAASGHPPRPPDDGKSAAVQPEDRQTFDHNMKEMFVKAGLIPPTGTTGDLYDIAQGWGEGYPVTEAHRMMFRQIRQEFRADSKDDRDMVSTMLKGDPLSPEYQFATTFFVGRGLIPSDILTRASKSTNGSKDLWLRSLKLAGCLVWGPGMMIVTIVGTT
jgi:hypothetical protein